MLKIACMGLTASLAALATPPLVALPVTGPSHSQAGIQLENMVFLFQKTSAA